MSLSINYYRDYSYDFVCKNIGEYNLDIIKRVALAGMPFVTQLEPVKEYFTYITHGMSALRIGTSGYSAYSEKELKDKAVAAAQCLYTISSVAATLFDHTYGRAMIGAIDTLHTLYDAHTHSDDKEKWFSEYCVQVLAQVIHIGLLFNGGSLPLALSMHTAQFALALLAAYREQTKGRHIEMSAHFITGLLHAYQGYQIYDQMMQEPAVEAPPQPEEDFVAEEATAKAEEPVESPLQSNEEPAVEAAAQSEEESKSEEETPKIEAQELEAPSQPEEDFVAEETTAKAEEPVESPLQSNEEPVVEAPLQPEGESAVLQAATEVENTSDEITDIEDDDDDWSYWDRYNKYEDVSEVNKPLARDMTMKEPLLKRVTKADLEKRLLKVIEERSVWIKDADGEEYNLGAHIHGFGPKVIEDHNLCFRKVETIRGDYIQLTFRTNKHSAKKVAEFINQVQSNILDYPALKVRFPQDEDSFIDLSVFNLGKVEIDVKGSILKTNSERNLIEVRVPAKRGYEGLQEVLTVVGLDNALEIATPQDAERLKVIQFMRVANLFDFFHTDVTSMPPAELKKRLFQIDPKLKSYMKEYMNGATLVDVIPGCSYYHFPKLSELARDKGAAGLTAALIIDEYSDKPTKQRIVAGRTASIIKNGLLSANDRHDALLAADGYLDGGSSTHEAHAFTQIIPVDQECSRLGYSGPVRLVFTLDLLSAPKLEGRGETDERYKKGDFFNFASRVNYLDEYHEILTPHAIPPEMIQGIIVKKKYMGHVMKALEDAKLIVDGCINGIPVEDFIQEADSVDPQVYRNAERYHKKNTAMAA